MNTSFDSDAQALSPRSENRSPRRGRYILIALLGIILLVPLTALAAVGGLLPASAINPVARLFVGRQPDAVPWVDNQPVTVLVMGLQIGGASTNPLTDSMMVVAYDPPTGSLSMLSIPRDLWVEIPGHGQGRINEAFEDGGAPLAMLTVQQNLGIPVNYYALVSYSAFRKLIDDVGGVTVNVPRDLDDPTFPADDEIHFEPLHLKAGVQHMDGREALRFARERHADPLGDIGRAQNQQQVLLALKDQLLKPANVLKAGLILRDIRSMVRTNFPLDQAAGLGLQALKAGKGNIYRDVLRYDNKTVQGTITASGADVLMLNQQASKPVIASLFGPALSGFKAGAKVRVDNGNGYPLAGTGYSKVLANMGAKMLEPGDADRTDYPGARVRVFTRDADKVREAGLLASMLGVPLEKASGSDPADIVVTLGRDYAPFVKFTSADWEKAIKP